MANDGYTRQEVERICERRVAAERERCASIADRRCELDRDRYSTESDWRMPYAFNRVIRASMDITSEIRKGSIGEPAAFKAPHLRGESDPDREAGLPAGSPMPPTTWESQCSGMSNACEQDEGA